MTYKISQILWGTFGPGSGLGVWVGASLKIFNMYPSDVVIVWGVVVNSEDGRRDVNRAVGHWFRNIGLAVGEGEVGVRRVDS